MKQVLVFGFFREAGGEEIFNQEAGVQFFLRVWTSTLAEEKNNPEVWAALDSEDWLKDLGFHQIQIISSWEEVLPDNLSKQKREFLRKLENNYITLELSVCWKKISPFISFSRLGKIALLEREPLRSFARKSFSQKCGRKIQPKML